MRPQSLKRSLICLLAASPCCAYITMQAQPSPKGSSTFKTISSRAPMEINGSLSRSSSTAIQYKNVEEDEAVLAPVYFDSSLINAADLDSLDLPKSFLRKENERNLEALLSLEVSIGRVAMVSAVLFFAAELVSKTSITEQVSNAFQILNQMN